MYKLRADIGRKSPLSKEELWISKRGSWDEPCGSEMELELSGGTHMHTDR